MIFKPVNWLAIQLQSLGLTPYTLSGIVVNPWLAVQIVANLDPTHLTSLSRSEDISCQCRSSAITSPNPHLSACFELCISIQKHWSHGGCCLLVSFCDAKPLKTSPCKSNSWINDAGVSHIHFHKPNYGFSSRHGFYPPVHFVSRILITSIINSSLSTIGCVLIFIHFEISTFWFTGSSME